MTVRQFLACARAAEDLIASPRVAAAWNEASALEGYTVGGLAGHLARAVLTVAQYLDRHPETDIAPTDAAGYLVRILATHDPVDSDFHRRVRDRGEQESSGGQTELVERVRVARQRLADRLDTVDTGEAITVLDQTVLSIEEYLHTRLVELVVHLDDLAVSVDAAPEGVPDEAYEIVARVLVTVAARRGGHLETVRSLARRERHPDAVRAL